MSLDYPNRADWLKVRSAQHDSIPQRVISRGTFNVGSKAEKRGMAATGRQRVKARKRLQREMRAKRVKAAERATA